jgi:hypothetical protein
VSLGGVVVGTISPVTVTASDLTGQVLASPLPYTLVDRGSGAKDLKARFGIPNNTGSVNDEFDAFNALHALINSAIGTDNFTGIIRLGDWIDLDSLSVAQDTFNLGEISATNTDLGEHGKLLRLIVVGINSFVGINSNIQPHVVFQFQNIPGTRRMYYPSDNSVGYLNSEMRTYLTANFLSGLTAAGVPSSVLWGPSRLVANAGYAATGTHTVTDTLWLPTEYEMFGANNQSSSTYEGAGTQASFTGYYTSNTIRIKYNSTNAATYYWEASPNSASTANFCSVNSTGNDISLNASAEGGCAPAFCIR